MRKIFITSLMLVGLLLSAGDAIALTAGDPIDKLASPETKALYNRLKSTSGNQIMFGQNYLARIPKGVLLDPYGTASECYKITGKLPMILHIDYEPDQYRSIALWTNSLKEHYGKGGIIMICWHMKNWVTGGDSRDLTGNPVVNILPGGSARAKYLSALDGFANYFLSLKDANGNLIPIIFRPFHENDGAWFWWGHSTRSSAQYVQLWRDLVTYLRDKKGVHNIIYCYSPEIIDGYAYDGALYPGDAYVDILGLDCYSKTVTANYEGGSCLSRLQTLYKLSAAKNKPFGLCEGLRKEFPNKLVSDPNSDGIYPKYWTDKFFKPILADSKAKYSSFIMVWASVPNSTTAGWGPVKGYVDEQSFKDVSNNKKIMFLKY